MPTLLIFFSKNQDIKQLRSIGWARGKNTQRKPKVLFPTIFFSRGVGCFGFSFQAPFEIKEKFKNQAWGLEAIRARADTTGEKPVLQMLSSF